MPVRRSSSNGGSVKVSRKPRVAIGSFKGSGDGVRTPRSKDSDVGKGQRKVRVEMQESKGSIGGVRTEEDNNRRSRKVQSKVATEESKGSSGGVRAREDNKRGSRKVQSRGNGNGGDAVPYRNVNGKSSDMRSSGKRDWKTKSGNEGRGGVIDRKLGVKSYRISADPRDSVQGKFDGNDKKFWSPSKRNALNSYPDNSKKPLGRKGYVIKDSKRNKLVTESGKFRTSESLDKRVRSGRIGDADKLKRVRDDGLGNGVSKINGKRKAPSATQTELNQRNNAVGYTEKSLYKKDRRTKTLLSDLTDEPRKKKKRGIRIDPNDTSNKRLDDSISDKGNNEVKIDKTESSGVEMSKNAQFRAICPSASILSFVDDNLLGRRREIEFRRAGYNIELSAPLDNIPFSTSAERERIEVPAFRNKLEFFAAAKVSSSFPPPELPEIAFAGRSNVGKSSLLNALTRQWGVVRTSDKPGLTQSINFFKLGPKLSLVDLPGYGFAYAKEEVKEAWEELVKEYVMTRVGLKRVCLLVDTKWGMKPRDLELIDLMERYETNYQIVLTKTDLVFPIDVARRAMQIEENLKAKKSAVQPLMMVSSTTGAGIRSLRTVLANVARFVR